MWHWRFSTLEIRKYKLLQCNKYIVRCIASGNVPHFCGSRCSNRETKECTGWKSRRKNEFSSAFKLPFGSAIKELLSIIIIQENFLIQQFVENCLPRIVETGNTKKRTLPGITIVFFSKLSVYLRFMTFPSCRLWLPVYINILLILCIVASTNKLMINGTWINERYMGWIIVI